MDATTCFIMLVHPVLCVHDTMKINLKELKITTVGLGQNFPLLTVLRPCLVFRLLILTHMLNFVWTKFH